MDTEKRLKDALNEDELNEITDAHFQEFEFKGEKYDLLYESMDPNKDGNKKPGSGSY